MVASKLLSPSVGMVSGCALLIDYILTIAISIAAGADAVFSFLPSCWVPFKLYFGMAGILLLTVMNLRGIKESVVPLVPVFLLFIITHFFAVPTALISHAGQFDDVAAGTSQSIHSTLREMGLFGMMALILRAYSMGAGTFTGIEAVSNGLQILREPKVRTGKRTMLYMAVSLAFTATGLMLAYLLLGVTHRPGKTLNAVLFETIAQSWGTPGQAFILLTLVSDAMLLLIAVQAGFLDGPRVMANIAIDRWLRPVFPS